MAAVTISVSDITPFVPNADSTLVNAMITDALALAAVVAPCISDAAFASDAAAKAIIRGAIVRWLESGSGAVTQQTAGPFSQSVDTRQQRRGMFWPSEITQLQALCADSDLVGGAFEVDTMPANAGTYGVDYWWSGPDTFSTEW